MIIILKNIFLFSQKIKTISITPVYFFIIYSLFISITSASTHVGGTISQDTEWKTQGSPYIVDSTIRVKGKSGGDSVTTLTIDAGVEVRFTNGKSMEIGDESDNSKPGALYANASGGNRIVFRGDGTSTWGSINFYRYSVDSKCLLDSCNFRRGSPNILCSNSSPRIRKCRIDSSLSYGIQIADTAASDSTRPIIVGDTIRYNYRYGINCSSQSTNCANAPQIDSCAFIGNGTYYSTYPIRVYANNVRRITHNTFSNNYYNGIEVIGEEIKDDATWHNQGAYYYLASEAYIKGQSGPDQVTVLTLEQGVEIRLYNGVSLNVGDESDNSKPGALYANASGGNRIVFRGDGANSWGSIKFNRYSVDSQCLLDSCDIRRGAPNILCSNSSPRIRKCRIDSSAYYYGIQIADTAAADSTRPIIVRDTIRYNGSYGIYCSSQSTNCANAPQIDSCAFIGNGTYYSTYPIRVYANNVRWITHNTFSNNYYDAIEVAGEIVKDDATWHNQGAYYYLNGAITVKGKSGSDSVTTLTLDPGVELRCAPGNISLDIGDETDSNQPGALIANASGGSRIVFRRNGTSGNWGAIKFNRYSVDSLCILDSCDIKYGGYNTNTSISCTNASPRIRKCRVDSSSTCGIMMNSNTSADSTKPVLVGDTIRGNVWYGLICYQSSGGVCGPRVDSCAFIGNGNVSYPYPVNSYANNVRRFTNNTFSNNYYDAIEVKGDTVKDDATWHNQGAYYYLNGAITVKGKSGSDSVTTLTLDPGVELRCAPGNISLDIGDETDSNQPGALIANASGGSRIVFRRNGTSGNWGAIKFNRYSVDSLCILDSCDIKYGGYNTNTSISCTNASPRIRKCRVDSSSYYGIMMNSNTSADSTKPVLIGNIIHNNNQAGIVCYQSAGCQSRPIMKNNDLYNETNGLEIYGIQADSIRHNSFWDCTYGAWNQYPTELMLTEQYWDDSLGPYNPVKNPNSNGCPVGDKIKFDPWLVSRDTLQFAIVNVLITKQNIFHPVAESTQITATLTQSGDWTCRFMDAVGQSVRSFSGSGTTINVIWDGTNASGNPVTNGLYYYRIGATSSSITAASVLGRIWVGIPIAEIDLPVNNATIIFDTTSIKGTAWSTLFKQYQLFYAKHSQPGSWTEISTSHNPVIDSILYVWNMSGVANDSYNIKLEVTDDSNNVGYDTVFNIYVNRLIIDSVTYSAVAFVPQDSESLLVSYRINHNVDSVIVKFFDGWNDSTDIIKTFKLTNVSAGFDTFYWNGTDSSGQIVTVGDYRLQIKGYEANGAQRVWDSNHTSYYLFHDWVGTFFNSCSLWGSFNAITDGYSGNLAAFSSCGSGITGPTKVGGRIKSGTPSVSNCFDTTATVRAINLSPQGAPFIYYWDGRDDSGNLVPSGYYWVEWDSLLYYGGGITYPEKTIIVGKYKPLADSAKVSPRLLLGNDEVSAIIFKLRWNSVVNVEVYKESQLVKTIWQNESKAKGFYHLEWNGKNNSGVMVTDTGEYTIKISITAGGMNEVCRRAVCVHRY